MPLPIILAGIAGAAIGGAIGGGIGALIDASKDNEEADELNTESQVAFEDAKERLEISRKNCANQLEELGQLRRDIAASQIKKAAFLLSKIRRVESSGDIDRPKLPSVSDRELREMTTISDSASSDAFILGTGAGALVAAGGFGIASMLAGTAGTATATLAWLGAGSVAAGSVLLGGAFIAPAILVGGLVQAAEAEENLAQAIRIRAEVEEVVSKIRAANSVLKGIRTAAKQYYQTTAKLSDRTALILDDLEAVIEKRSFLGVVEYSRLNESDKRKLYTAVEFIRGLNTLIRAPILTKEGALDENYRKAIGDGRRLLDRAR